MTVGHGHVASGGQNSQLDVRRLDTGEIVYKGHCGGSVNNALHIARDATQQVCATACRSHAALQLAATNVRSTAAVVLPAAGGAPWWMCCRPRCISCLEPGPAAVYIFDVLNPDRQLCACMLVRACIRV